MLLLDTMSTLGFKLTPPSSFDDAADHQRKKQPQQQSITDPDHIALASDSRSDEEIIREHIAAKQKHKFSSDGQMMAQQKDSKVSHHKSSMRTTSTGNLGPFNGLDLDLPPPPSPPCTCGKNLPILPTDQSLIPDMAGLQRYSSKIGKAER